MAKIYVQNSPTVLSYSGSLAASGSISSGSFACAGYTELRGGIISSGSGGSSSALAVYQSIDNGQNFDFVTSFPVSACAALNQTIAIFGNALEIVYHGDTTASTSEIRTRWTVIPVA